MLEIRIHGRGGQGGVTLAKIIATIRFLQGDSAQAFGLYAAERSGAPVQAFCRYSPEPIANRNLIYEPDHIIVLDPTLVGPAISNGLKAGGWILINSPESPASFAADFPSYRIATVDATAIARAHGLGTKSLPIVNTALAGATARILDFPLADVDAALEHLAFVGGNLGAARDAHEQCQRSDFPAPVAESESAAPVLPGRGPSLLSGAGGELPRIRTGQWASQQPQRQQLIPPCNHVCPAGNDVQGFLLEMAHDNVDQALEVLLRTSPLPAVCGRVCPAPCMDACNRVHLDDSVNVRQLERYAGDHGSVQLTAAAARDERVAVVGSGPAGLTVAYHLGLLGYAVTVFEAGEDTGGLLRNGIPEFRLSDEVLERELDRIRGLGVAFTTGHRIDRQGLFELAGSFDAVLVATGLQELRGLRLGIDGADAVQQGIDFLDRVHDNAVRVDGEDIVVVGGGNTAIDTARSALRLGAKSVLIIYRRTRDEMPAIREEIEEALAEGVTIEYLTQPMQLKPYEEAGNGRGPGLYTLVCRQMRLGEPDASGRRAPVEIPDSEFEISCHRVFLALGQSPDLTVFPEGTEVREGDRLLGLLERPVFAVGDLATGDGTVAAAIGSGRRAALHIHEALTGELIAERGDHSAAARWVDVWKDEVVKPEAMKMHLFERQAIHEGAELDARERIATFDEVHAGLNDIGEAKRCLSCGVCNECDRCVIYCPEGVLKRVGHEFVFDYSYCKGCAVCASECPRNVIFMSHL